MTALITPTDKRVFKVWWSIEWRTVLFATVVGTAVSIPLALLNVVLAWVVASLIGMYISFVVIKWVLTRKLYSDFTIALIEKERVIEALKSFSAPTMIKKGKIFFWSRKEGKYLNEEEYLEKFKE